MSVGVLYPSCSTASSSGSIRPIDLKDGGEVVDVEASSGDGIVVKARQDRCSRAEEKAREGTQKSFQIPARIHATVAAWHYFREP